MPYIYTDLSRYHIFICRQNIVLCDKSTVQWKPSRVLTFGSGWTNAVRCENRQDGEFFLGTDELSAHGHQHVGFHSRYIITRFVFVTFLAREELLLINSCTKLTGFPLYKLLRCPLWRHMDDWEERCYQQFINCLRTFSTLSKN